MKRHLRIVIDASTATGHCLAKSGWFTSRTFERVTLASYKPSYDDQDEFGDRVTAALGFKWKPWRSSFVPGDTFDPDLRVKILAPSSVTRWLDANASGLWLPCTTSYYDSLGWLRQDVQFWFQDETDATLFTVTYP